MKPESVISILIFFAMALNGLWYYVKYILRQHGYETHLFWGHFQDISNLYKLYHEERDLGKKRNFRILLIAFYTGIGLFLVAGVIMFSSR